MSAYIAAGGVIPTSVEHLKHTADFIIPPYRQIMTGKIGKVHKVQFILIGKRPEAETIINISHQPQLNLMLKVEFYPFIFSSTFKYSFYSPFIVHRKCRIVRAEIDLTLSVHIIIKRRSPFHPDARGKADIGISEAFHKFRRRHRIVTRNHKTGFLDGCSLVCRETEADIQSVGNFKTMTEVEIQVLEIIQMDEVEIKDTVRHRFQFVQHLAAIDAVTITHTQPEKAPFLRPVLKVGIQRPVELFPCKVITQFGHDAEPLVTSENPIVTEVLPVRQSVASAITEQKRIDKRREADTSDIGQIEFIIFHHQVAHRSPESLTLGFSLHRHGIPSVCVILIKLFFPVTQRNGT